MIFDVPKTVLVPVFVVATYQVFAQPPITRPAFDHFEVAKITPTAPDWKGGAYFRMQSGHRFIVQNYTVQSLVAAAWNLPTRLVSGGPAWSRTDPYDIVAGTPGELRPDRDEQMSMLRKLLLERFKLTFHRETKRLLIYELRVANNGPKMKQSEGPPPEGRPAPIFSLFPVRRARLPVRDATMAFRMGPLRNTRAKINPRIFGSTGTRSSAAQRNASEPADRLEGS